MIASKIFFEVIRLLMINWPGFFLVNNRLRLRWHKVR